ncbi:helix-turn-helix transcriptional regulator [Amycolatopsis suaedae]|uniref:LuxR family transcriptional regulator n=1 Tax=Amycolatopsis suaedae TaxID=2510978 RepID=A0A4Q7JAF5_9PSEU|nr:LuxR family transcriptional regulator [Amycolatopsis suaedae]RZQ63174.1 LuxR family transcriptional regulator [Amycolatopsis suaedae]
MLIVPRLGSGIPLVGRVEQLRGLRAALARAERNEARAVLLAGDAGVGKTRLLAELAEHATATGALVLTGRCLDLRDGGLPYLPFAEALTPLAAVEAVRARPALGRLLPQLGAVFTADADQLSGTASERDGLPGVRTQHDLGQLQLFDAVLGLLAELSETQPVVLVLEDLHWADGSTRGLLSFLVSRLRAQRLLIVASYREEDVHRRHPLRALLADLVRVASVERMDLPPFGEDEARAFVEALAEGKLAPATVADVIERSEGNPFFVEELLASVAECGDGRAGAELPAGLAEVLLARLERLGPDTQRVLRVASVADGGVGHALLTDVAGLDETRLDEALREAVQHHVLVVERTHYAFRHALLKEAVHGDLLPGERTRLHAAYAARLLTQPGGRGRDALLAHHSLESNDLPTALAASLRAATEAEKLGAPDAALGHTEKALSIWDAVPPGERPEGVDELKLLHHAAYFAGASGEPERAVAYARSATQALDDTVPAERAATIWRRLAESQMAMDSTWDESVASIGRAWELVEHLPASRTRAWVLGTRARIMRGLHRSAESLESARQAVADARASDTLGAEADGLITLGILAEFEGDRETARERLREARRKAQQAGSVNVELRALYFLALSYDDEADLPAALRAYTECVDAAAANGLVWSGYGIEARARRLYLRYLTGDWPAWEAGKRPHLGVSSSAASRAIASWVYIALARGDFAEVDRLLTGLRPLWRSDAAIAVAAGAIAVELACWRRDWAEAVRRTEETLGWLEEYDDVMRLATLRITAHAIAGRAGQAEEARLRGAGDAAAEAVRAGEALRERVEHAARVGKPRSGTLGPEGRAWLARARAEASRLGGTPDPELWKTAVAEFGYGARYEQAVCRWRYAEALLAADDAEAAAAELADVHELATKLGARPLAEAVRELAGRAKVALPGVATVKRDVVDPLTDRERAVLERVAQGRTNRQVGAELFISEKTVSVHLSRAMAKLGASRRAEAVAIAYDRGLLTR